MDVLCDEVVNVIKSVYSSREDRVLDALNTFRKDLFGELACLKQILQSHVCNEINVNRNHFDGTVTAIDNSSTPKCVKVLSKHDDNFHNNVRSENAGASKTISQIMEYPKKQGTIDQLSKQLSAIQSSIIKTEVSEDTVPVIFGCQNSDSESGDTSMYSTWLLPENTMPSTKHVEFGIGGYTAEIVDVNTLKEPQSCSEITESETSSHEVLQTTFIDVYDPKKQLATVMDTEEVKNTSEEINKVLQKCAAVNEKKKFQCEVCNKLFVRKRTLKDHMYIHTNEKQFKCLICDKLFHRKRSIREHVKLHHAEKKHKCEHCGKSFTKKNSLNRHILIHTGEKPFQCTTCNKSFTRKETLKIHVEHTCGKKTVGPSLEMNWIEIPTDSMTSI